MKPTWFCRVKVPNAKGYVSCSTKTTDEHQAFAFANDLFNKTLVKAASGQEVNSKKITIAIKEFVTHIKATESKRATTTTRAQFLEKTATFFGSKRLKEITTSTLINLNDWTVVNSKKQSLSPNTIKRYSTDLKQFFNWCLEKDYIEKIPRFWPATSQRVSSSDTCLKSILNLRRRWKLWIPFQSCEIKKNVYIISAEAISN